MMNFGSLGWTFGSIVEDYSNTPFPPVFFPATNPATCAKLARKKATKYSATRVKEYSKCLEKIAKGDVCDTVKRDQKVNNAKTKLEQTIDTTCSNDQIANVNWCGTTIASLKACLVAEIDAATTDTITAIYGAQ